MNKQIIIGKLNNFLNKHPIFKEECEAVYFLAEIRKLIEDDTSNYRTLYFYCCWVVHSKLSRNIAADFLSAKFDSLIDFQKKRSEIQHDLINGQKDFFKLRDLNDQLRAFLNTSGLPINFLNGNAWYKFCQLFLDNFTECEINISAINNKPHKVNRLVVEKNSQQYHYVFYLANGVRVPSILLKY